MVKVKKEEFVKWIMEQPDDRKVDMVDPVNGSNNCGCVMVQYGREHFKVNPILRFFGKKSFTHCGLRRWGMKAVAVDFNLMNLFYKAGWSHANNFGDLKKLIKN